MSTQINYNHKIDDENNSYGGSIRIDIDIRSASDIEPEDYTAIIKAISSIRETLATYPKETN